MRDESIGEATARIRRALHNRCDPDCACVTAVAVSSAADVLSGFRADKAAPPLVPHHLPAGTPAASLLEVPGGIVAVEDGGLQGSELATLRRLSRGTRAASMYWNGVGDVGIAFARDGVILHGTGDELPTHGNGADPDVASLFEDLDPSVHGNIYAGLIAIERFTGLRIDGDPLQQPALVHPLRQKPERLMPALGAIRAATLSYDGGENRSGLSSAIARLPPAEQRRLAATAARTMMRLAEVHMSPAIVEALEWLTNPAGPRFSEEVEIAMLRARRAESRGVKNANTRALRVLATAANPDPHLAALEAIWGVRDALSPAAQAQYDAGVQQYLDQAAGRS